MSGFLYFKPQWQKPVTLADVQGWGLGYAFAERVSPCRCIGNSPTGTGGTTFADRARLGDCDVKMDLANQTWRKIPHSDVWVGYWNAARPTPESLARMPQLMGYRTRMADGGSWMIPLVRRFDSEQLTTVSNLPCYMEVDEHGNWQRAGVVGVHGQLWDATAPIADALLKEYTKDEAPEVTDADIFNCVTALLAANYVVGPAELSLLKVISTEASTHAACMVACDWPTFMEWSEDQKKSESPLAEDGSTTSAGAAA